MTVVEAPDGRLTMRYKGVDLPERTFDKFRQVDQGAITGNKRLGPMLAIIRDKLRHHGPERCSGPRWRDQRNARLFKVDDLLLLPTWRTGMKQISIDTVDAGLPEHMSLTRR